MMRLITLLLAGSVLFSCSQDEKHTHQEFDFNDLDLRKYSRIQLETDFDLLINSLKEAHTGLYWYSSERQFDSVLYQQRIKLKDSLNGLEFYNIVAPIVAYTKEDHCDIIVSDEISKFLSAKGLFLPLSVINLNSETWILNDPVKEVSIKGYELLSINNVGIDLIRDRIFRTFASDGYILSSKYRYLDFRGFSREYAQVVGQFKGNSITVLNPQTNRKETYRIPSVSAEALKEINKRVFSENDIRTEIERPAALAFLNDKTVLLSFRTFSNKKFERYGMEFKAFVDSSFNLILTLDVKNLVIDIRDNGGGSEGNEDYLFSYLTNKPYAKYKYVEASGLTFSFLDFTDYSSKNDKEDLEEELRLENKEASDGRYYRKSGIYMLEPVKENPFSGNLYILISGWTYSGGAEFATLIKEHTNAMFIGEEAGGGYYGNTSGTLLELTLPNTQLKIDIPILKFVLDVKKGVFGHGVIPDYEVQPTFEELINGYDAEMEFVRDMIKTDEMIH